MSTRKLKVVILHNFPTPYRLEMFRRLLDDEELDLRIAFTGRPKENRPTWSTSINDHKERISFMPGVGIPVHGKFEDRVFLNFGLDRLLRWNPDVVLLFGFSDPTNIIMSKLCSMRKIPYVLFAEMSYVWNTGIAAKVFRPLIASMIRGASHLVPASESAAAFFRAMGAKGDRVTIIPCVPDLERLATIRAANLASRDDIARRFGLEGKFIVMYVGRLQPYKGIVEMFDGLDKVIEQTPGVCLVVAGTGPLEDYVRLRCLKNPSHLKYVGMVDDQTLHSLYTIANLHIMPSWSEAFGVVCAEALAFGVPSIVTRTSGCSDLITNEVNGFLIDPKSADAIAEAVTKALENPKRLEAMGDEALCRIQKLSMEEIASSVKRIILSATVHGAEGRNEPREDP
jgi:glycosyltransferase involved in cell wall biosynthesis